MFSGPSSSSRRRGSPSRGLNRPPGANRPILKVALEARLSLLRVALEEVELVHSALTVVALLVGEVEVPLLSVGQDSHRHAL